MNSGIYAKMVKSLIAPAALAASIVPASLAPTSLEGRLEESAGSAGNRAIATQAYFSDSFDDYALGDFPHDKWTWRVLNKEHGNAPRIVRSTLKGNCLYFPQNWNKYSDVSPNIFETKEALSNSIIEFDVSQGKLSTFHIDLMTNKDGSWRYACSDGFGRGSSIFYVDEQKYERKYKSFGRYLQAYKAGEWDNVKIKLTPDTYIISINGKKHGPFAFPEKLGEHINVQFDKWALIPKGKVSSGDYKIDEFKIRQ